MFTIVKLIRRKTNWRIIMNTLDTHRSTSNMVCEILRREIIEKTIPLGERLVEAKIAKELNVSITPVRHAFVKLAEQGLLTVYPFKGTYVTEITREYLEEVYFVRERLELAAIDLCFHKLTAQDADRLDELTNASERSYQEGNMYDAVVYDLGFHEYFFTLGGNGTLTELWEKIKSRLHMFLSYSKPITLSANYMQTRHRPIVDAVREPNLEALKGAMSEHIRTSVTRNQSLKGSELRQNKEWKEGGPQKNRLNGIDRDKGYGAG